MKTLPTPRLRRNTALLAGLILASSVHSLTASAASFVYRQPAFGLVASGTPAGVPAEAAVSMTLNSASLPVATLGDRKSVV